MTTKLTNQEIQEKSQILMALALSISSLNSEDNNETYKAIRKLSLELAKDVNGLTL